MLCGVFPLCSATAVQQPLLGSWAEEKISYSHRLPKASLTQEEATETSAESLNASLSHSWTITKQQNSSERIREWCSTYAVNLFSWWWEQKMSLQKHFWNFFDVPSVLWAYKEQKLPTSLFQLDSILGIKLLAESHTWNFGWKHQKNPYATCEYVRELQSIKH